MNIVIPQHFGCLVFDRATTQYTPFDHPATAVLTHAAHSPVWPLAARDPAVAGFVDHFLRVGMFAPDGRLAGRVLAATPPPDHLLGPLVVHTEIVAACNLTCRHCFAGELPRKTTLSLVELARLFGELAELGCFRVGVTGGEPLLRKDLFDIIDAATDRGVVTSLTTNGLLLDDHHIRAFARRQLGWLNISLDGATAHTNDRIRGSGTFAAVIERIRRASSRLRFSLAFTVTSESASEVAACAALARELGAESAVFRPLYPVGNARHHRELMPTFAQYNDALASLTDDDLGARCFSPDHRATTQAISYRGPGCGAANLIASVSASGDVNPCSFLGASFESGNLRDRSFRDIWNAGHAFSRLRRSQVGASDRFTGGCRARALAAHGDADAADPWHDEWIARRAPDPPPTATLTATLAATRPRRVHLPVVR